MNCTFETDTKHNLMRVWVEPAEWEGPERPIVRYDVRLRHYIGRKKVSGSEAVGSRTGGCKSDLPLASHRCLLTDCRRARDGCVLDLEEPAAARADPQGAPPRVAGADAHLQVRPQRERARRAQG